MSRNSVRSKSNLAAWIEISTLLALLLIAQLTFASSGHGSGSASKPWKMMETPASEVPPELENVGITEKLGDKVDLSLPFQNELGQTVTLGQYFDGKRPVLLSVVYYNCPGLCNFHLNGVAQVLKDMDWKLGREFDMVVVSMDHKETPDLATKKKANYLDLVGDAELGKGWHFLVGSAASVKTLTDQLGFGFRWDTLSQQWAHSSAIHVLTPAGVISRYLYGIQFDPKTVRLSLVEASQGKLGTVIDRLILTCFQYNPDTRGYAFYAYNIVRFGAGLAAIALLAFLIPIWRRERSRSLSGGVAS